MSFRPALILAAALATWTAAANAETIKIGVTPRAACADPGGGEAGRRQEGPRHPDRRVLRLRGAERGADAGDIQANSFQNQPYLDNQKADRGYKIESVGLTVNFPIGVYSKK